MKEEVEISGWWWLPHDPDNKIPGTLVIQQGSIATLEALRAFPRKPDAIMDDIPIILGKSEREIVTLLNSYEARGPADNNPARHPYSPCTIKSTAALVGAHVVSPDFLVIALRAEYTNLNQWANIDRQMKREEKDGVLTLTANIQEPIAVITGSLDNNYTVSVHVGNYEKLGPAYHRGFESQTHLEITAGDGSGSLEDFEKLSRDLRNLFTLFVHQPVYVDKMSVRVAQTADCIETRHGQGWAKLYRVSGYRKKGEYTNFHPSRMLVPLRSIKEELPAILRSWLTDAEKYDLAYHLYFGVAFNKGLYIESQFLSYIQALEGYHRRIQEDNRYIPRQQYREQIPSVIQSLVMPDDFPPDLQKNIENAIRRANELSLRERLYKIMQRRGERFLTEFFGDTERRGEFIQRVVGTRNYLSHALDPDPDDVQTMYEIDDDFVLVIERLQVLVEACLLEITGMAQEKIDSILLNRDNEYPIQNHNEDSRPSSGPYQEAS